MLSCLVVSAMAIVQVPGESETIDALISSPGDTGPISCAGSGRISTQAK